MKKIILAICAVMLTNLIAYAQADKPATDDNIAKEVKLQTVCPVDGAKINRTVFVDVKCKRIFLCYPECVSRVNANPEKFECYRNFCRDGCRDKVKANPDKYMKILEEQGVTLEEAPKINKINI